MPERVKRLNKDDIMRIVSDVLSEKEDDQKEQLSEDFPMFAGKGDERSSLISNGFKIKHSKSGLTYTCKKLAGAGKDLFLIVIDDGNGKTVSIPRKDFSKYERM